MAALILPLVKKLLLWALPQVVQIIVEYFRFAVEAVHDTADVTGPESPRELVIARLKKEYPYLPEAVHRLAHAAAAVCVEAGLDMQLLYQAESEVAVAQLEDTTGADKRCLVLTKIGETPQAQTDEGTEEKAIPSESVQRLVTEIACQSIKANPKLQPQSSAGSLRCKSRYRYHRKSKMPCADLPSNTLRSSSSFNDS